MSNDKEYYERDLVKVVDSDGKVTYWAVNEKTAENMVNTSDALKYHNTPELQFTVEELGPIFVQETDHR